MVSRLKNSKNYQYSYESKWLSIAEIYGISKKRRGKSRYLLSVTVEVRHNDFNKTVSAKIVYVRDRANRKKWIALISTDVLLSEEEAIVLYDKRWDIETFHKVIKSVLHLEKEFQLRSYDAMTAHTTIVMSRYIFLAIENRENIDWWSVNESFYFLSAELEDLSFACAFQMILKSMKDFFKDHF